MGKKCKSGCTCGRHQRGSGLRPMGGGAWNPFKHAKRDFNNVGKAFKTAGNAIAGAPMAIHNDAIARQVLGGAARFGAARFGLGGLAGVGLSQVGYGRKRVSRKRR